MTEVKEAETSSSSPLILLLIFTLTFILGLNTTVFPTTFVEETMLSPEGKHGVIQVLTGFIFGIGSLIATMLIALIYMVIKRAIKPTVQDE